MRRGRGRRLWRGPAFGVVLALSWVFAVALGSCAAAAPTLERVVVVMRHGVRPPTQGPDALLRFSPKPWPSWPAPPGALTPHGAQTVRLMARSLAETYRREGVLPATGCPPAGAVLVRADGQDQRTRASGQAAADALAPGCGLQVRSGPEGEADPLFDSLPLCPLDEAEVRAGVLAAAGQGGLVAPAARRALERLQAVAAPDGCAGEGPCLSAPTRLVVKPSGARLEGGLGEGATLGEIFLLEYAEGLPLPQVAWGAAVDPAFFEAVLAAHAREAALTRRVLPVAAHRGLLLARAVVRALHGLSEDGRPDGPKLVLFAGHDTNLSNLAGIFGLDWTLEGQPDATAPATALAFELWREPESGRATVRAVVYYETLDQLRTLQPQRAQAKALDLGICAGAQACTIAAVESALAARLPKVCPATAGAR